MIIVRLTGGLGNQLFQYAAARRLALVNDTSLKFDVSHFERNPSRTYALGYFNIQGTIALSKEIAWFTGRERIRRLKWFLHSLQPYPYWKWVRQTSSDFDPTVLTLRGNIYLDGVWQSERYFVDVAPTIRDDLIVREKPDAVNLVMAEQIRQVESVCVHIRRGDYVTNPATQRVHGLCSLEYYRSAVCRLTAQVHSPHFFVFSDDLHWAKENLQLEYPTTLVSHNSADKHYEDLRLMSQCRYHIVANSSFSWWGAWLSPYPEKNVIAPRRWYQDFKYDISDIVPAGWQLLDV